MRARAAALAAGFLLSGCAAMRCAPATILVTDRDQQIRLETRVESLGVHPVTGRVHEITRDVIERRYWVRAADGDWVAVDEATWQRAETGRPLEVCR